MLDPDFQITTSGDNIALVESVKLFPEGVLPAVVGSTSGMAAVIRLDETQLSYLSCGKHAHWLDTACLTGASRHSNNARPTIRDDAGSASLSIPAL